MAIFCFEFMLAKSIENVSDLVSSSEIFSSRGNWWKVKGKDHDWLIYSIFLGMYIFRTRSAQSSITVWKCWSSLISRSTNIVRRCKMPLQGDQFCRDEGAIFLYPLSGTIWCIFWYIQGPCVEKSLGLALCNQLVLKPLQACYSSSYWCYPFFIFYRFSFCCQM